MFAVRHLNSENIPASRALPLHIGLAPAQAGVGGCSWMVKMAICAVLKIVYGVRKCLAPICGHGVHSGVKPRQVMLCLRVRSV